MLSRAVPVSVFCSILFASGLAFGGAALDDELSSLRRAGLEQGWTFVIGRTPISEVAADQLFGYRPSYDQSTPHIIPNEGEPPASWDWRQWGVVTPIRDQALPQYCGSCWAHGTAAAFESAIAMQTGRLYSFSVQQLVSCSPSYGSCNGGDFAFGFYKRVGAALDADFPYAAADVSCKSGLTQHFKAKSWAYVGASYRQPSTDEIKRAIYQFGPVAVTVSASGAWKHYRGGVYNECNHNGTNHIVAIVGWDDTDQAWIVKNSHGTEWGEDGYMRIKYTGSQGAKCNRIGEQAALVVVE